MMLFLFVLDDDPTVVVYKGRQSQLQWDGGGSTLIETLVVVIFCSVTRGEGCGGGGAGTGGVTILWSRITP